MACSKASTIFIEVGLNAHSVSIDTTSETLMQLLW